MATKHLTPAPLGRLILEGTIKRRSLKRIAQDTGLSEAEVAAFRQTFGWPRIDRMRENLNIIADAKGDIEWEEPRTAPPAPATSDDPAPVDPAPDPGPETEDPTTQDEHATAKDGPTATVQEATPECEPEPAPPSPTADALAAVEDLLAASEKDGREGVIEAAIMARVLLEGLVAAAAVRDAAAAREARREALMDELAALDEQAKAEWDPIAAKLRLA